jgi:hypothetical protein
MEQKTRRRKRCDRSYVIYQLQVNDQIYIGITARTQTPEPLPERAKILAALQRHAQIWRGSV